LKERTMRQFASPSRREFLRGAAAAVAAPCVIPSSVLGSPGLPAPSNRITFGCVGVGNQGGGHVNSLCRSGEAQIVAVCDVDTDHRLKAKQTVETAYSARSPGGAYKGCDAYNDFREVIQRKDIDAVLCATPDQWHALIAVAAMKAGKDVYCEKPLTLTIAEGRVIVEVAKRYGCIFQTGTQRRSFDKCRRACELVRNGRIGKLQRVEVGIGLRPVKPEFAQPEPVPAGFDYDMWLGPAPWAPYTKNRCHYNFRFIRDYSGGEMTNFGAHYMDLAQWGIGSDQTGPVRIEGQGEFFADGLYDTFSKVEVHYTYAGGVELVCTSKPGGCRFFGSEGWIDGDTLACEPKSLASATIGPDDIHLYQSRSHMGNFMECVRTRRQPACPAEIGHRSVTVCHLGNIAMTLKRPVRWDPAGERFVNDPEADRLLWRALRAPWSL
jgi:predicted dehydrogenase